MIKRIKMLGLIIILLIITNVKADSEVFFMLDCPQNTINKSGTLACDISAIWNGVNLTSLSLDYETDFTTMFVREPNTEVVFSNSHADFTLEDFPTMTFMPIKIATMLLDSKGLNESSVDINITNIVFKNSENDEIIVNDFSKTININLDYVQDSVCELNSITVEGAQVPNFSSDKYEYNGIYVNKNSVFIDAVRKSNKSSVTGVGKVYVPENQTVIRTIRVKAENGDYKEYKLELINKEKPADILADEVNNDNSLSSLELYANNNKINFNFEPGKTIYIVGLSDRSIKSLTVRASLNDSKATFVSGFGPRNINVNYGDNLIEVKVKAENGEVRTYLVNVSKEDNRSNDNTLKSLKVNDVIVPLKLNQFAYSVTLNHNVSETNISFETSNENARVEFSNIELEDGDNDSIVLKVYAENEDVREYTLNIYRLSENENNVSLNNIIIEGYNYNFNKDIYSYDLNINNENSLNIIVEPRDVRANIIGNENLSDGSAIIVQVNDEESRNYTFNIHKNNNPKDSKESIVLPLIVLIIGFLSLGCSIFYTIKVNKKNTLE